MEKNSKDIHRFSHSRLDCLTKCPMKHHYIYVEQIETKENEYTIPGKMFHACLERKFNGQPYDDILQEFANLCSNGKLEMDPDTLEYVLKEYFRYYRSDFQWEEQLMVEKEFTDYLNDEDYIMMVVDRVYRKDGRIYVRDTKTTQKTLKYEHDDVQYNSQILLYVPFVEEELNEKVDAIQIDEVRLAKLQDVPVLNNGKPTTDKKKLGLVTAEAYRAKVEEVGMEDDPKYQEVCEWLEQRGHPLFNRITCQILDQSVISANSMEVIEKYNIAKMDPKYRNKGPLCDYCAFKELCSLDMHLADSQSREMLKDRLK